MIIKEILAQAAFLLGLGEEAERLNQGDYSGEETAKLLRCYNFVENEIALDYLPLTAEETVSSKGGTIAYSSFSHSPVSVLGVTDEWGNRVPFDIFPEFIKTVEGTLVVTYTYSPVKKTATEHTEYDARVPAHLLSYGVACEYCLIGGRYEESLVWDRKYKDALLCICSVNRPRAVRARRWV